MPRSKRTYSAVESRIYFWRGGKIIPRLYEMTELVPATGLVITAVAQYDNSQKVSGKYENILLGKRIDVTFMMPASHAGEVKDMFNNYARDVNLLLRSPDREYIIFNGVITSAVDNASNEMRVDIKYHANEWTEKRL